MVDTALYSKFDNMLKQKGIVDDNFINGLVSIAEAHFTGIPILTGSTEPEPEAPVDPEPALPEATAEEDPIDDEREDGKEE